MFENLKDVYGIFLTKGGGWANLPLLMEVTRSWLKREGMLVEEEWLPARQDEAVQERFVDLLAWAQEEPPVGTPARHHVGAVFDDVSGAGHLHPFHRHEPA